LLCFKNVDNEKRAELLSIENAHLQQQNKTYLLEVKQTELYKMLLEDSKMIIFDYDIEKNSFAVYRKTETGERYCRTLENYMTDGVPNGNTLCPSCYSLFQEKMKQALSTPIKDRFEILLNLYGDSFVWCRVHYKSIQDDSTGKIFRIVGRLYDIDKDVKTKEQLSIKSNTDSLSGLLNRLTFENIVNDKTKDSDARYAFCLIDIDNFKQINDSFGHPVGDKVIVELSKMLSATVPHENVVARTGGDEFAILFDLSKFSTETLIENINTLFTKSQEVGKTLQLPTALTFSAGITLTSPKAHNFDSLYYQSDKALYFSKQNNKNVYTFYKNRITTD
ncbi:MAG: GGDEF domain-containing protein, partial [Clostridia bacterium]